MMPASGKTINPRTAKGSQSPSRLLATRGSSASSRRVARWTKMSTRRHSLQRGACSGSFLVASQAHCMHCRPRSLIRSLWCGEDQAPGHSSATSFPHPKPGTCQCATVGVQWGFPALDARDCRRHQDASQSTSTQARRWAQTTRRVQVRDVRVAVTSVRVWPQELCTIYRVPASHHQHVISSRPRALTSCPPVFSNGCQPRCPRHVPALGGESSEPQDTTQSPLDMASKRQTPASALKEE
jgi:hypothetical protein